MKSEVKVVRDESMKATGSEKEIVTIDIKCEQGKVDEHKQRKSVVCITFDEEEKGMEFIVAGSFSPMRLMAYIEALDSFKRQLIKKVARTLSDGLGDIIKSLEEEDK